MKLRDGEYRYRLAELGREPARVEVAKTRCAGSVASRGPARPGSRGGLATTHGPACHLRRTGIRLTGQWFAGIVDASRRVTNSRWGRARDVGPTLTGRDPCRRSPRTVGHRHTVVCSLRKLCSFTNPTMSASFASAIEMQVSAQP